MCITVLPLKGQNLIHNGGFEDTLSCPDFGDQIWKAKGWFAVSGTPSLHHTCSSNPYISIPSIAHKNLTTKDGMGLASCGVNILNNQITFYQYISSRLKSELIINHDYCLVFWVLTSDSNRFAIDKIGILFTSDSLKFRDGVILQEPQLESIDSKMINFNKWEKFEFNFTASGLEKYITLGQFNQIENIKIDTLKQNNTFSTWWFLDDISLVDCTPELVLEIPNVFTPNADGENDSFTATIENVESVQVHIYNRWGGEVFSSQDPNFRWNGTHNGQDLAEGVYFVVIQAVGLNGETVTEKQTVHLFR